MGRLRSLFIFAIATSAVHGVLHGQVGLQPFGSFQGTAIDQVDLARLNVHIDIPLFDHQARGAANGASVHLVYDSSKGASGDSWVLIAGTARGGSVNVQAVDTENCSGRNVNNGTNTLYSYSFTDSTGYTHPFAGTSRDSFCTAIPNPEPSTPLNEFAPDGSGYYLRAQGQQAMVSTPSGSNYIYNFSSTSVMDSNGNTGSEGGITEPAPDSGYFPYALTDNTNVSVHVSGGDYVRPQSGPPTSRNPAIVQYTDSTGHLQSITISYQIHTVAFLASTTPTQSFPGIGLVDSITYPDGSAYHFTYQPSPYNANQSTGVLSGVTLPTGGTIAYQNTFSSCYGAAVLLSRTTSDGTTRYSGPVTTPGTNSQSCTVSLNETSIAKADQTREDIHFVSDQYDTLADALVLETAHFWYDNGGNQVKSTMRCYNGATSDCTTTAVNGTISSISTTTTLGNQSSKIVQTFNASSLPAEIDTYDYGASSPSKKVITNYAALGNNISNAPQSVTVYSTSGAIAAQTTYGYDESTASPTSGIPGHATVTGARGNQTSVHQLLATSGTSLSTTFTYDDAGNVLTKTDPQLNQTTYAYDAGTASCLQTTTLPTTGAGASIVTRQTCDPGTGLVATTTDPNGIVTHFQYDAALRSTGSTLYNGTTIAGNTAIVNGSPTLPIVVTTTVSADPNPSEISSVTYDGYGRVAKTIDAAGAIIDTTYDFLGRVGSLSNPHLSSPSSSDGVTTFSYDALSRTVLQCQPDNGTNTAPCTANLSYQQWVYSGNVTTFYDEQRNAWIRTSDALGRLTSVREPSGAQTSYTYDALDNLLSANQQGLAGESPRIRTFTYDSLSRLLCASYPESSSSPCPTSASTPLPAGVIAYSYDGNGNLIRRIDARGAISNYHYDSLNRISQKDYSAPSGSAVTATPTVMYGYDTSAQFSTSNGLGHLVTETVTDASNNVLFRRNIPSYNALGNVITDQRCVATECPGALVTSYTYDLAGHETTATLPYISLFGILPTVINYSYDKAGRPTSVVATATSSPAHVSLDVLDSAVYSPFGSITTASELETRAYDTRGRVSNITYNAPTINLNYVATYNYYANGNLQANADSVNGSWTYLYDNLNRLHTATLVSTPAGSSVAPGTTTYGYDSFGNRLSQSGMGVTSQQSFSNPTNRADCVYNNAASTGCYDASGDQLFDLNSATTHGYTYDAEGRLSGVTPSGYAYLYDGEGTRIAEFVNGTLKRRYDRDLLSQFYVVSDTTMAHSPVLEVFGAGRHLATFSDDVYLSFGDNVGTERIRIGYFAGSVQNCTNLPFGDGQTCTLTDPSPLHFTGKESDTESGLDYFGARYYSSNMGRFMSPDDGSDQDLNDPQSLSLYSYVRNNPLTNIDPSGLTCVANSSDGNTVDNGDGQGCSAVDAQNAAYEARHEAAATVYAGNSSSTGTVASNVGNFISGAASSTMNYVSQVGSQLSNIAQTPGGIGCMASLAGSGGMSGVAVGGGVGLAGLAGGGVGVLVTEPAGLAIGGVGGAASGFALGMTVCPGGAMAMSNSGAGFGGNQRENKQANDAKQEAERDTGKKFDRALDRKFHDEITGQGYGYHELVEIAKQVLQGHI